jgi:hypothetical protein
LPVYVYSHDGGLVSGSTATVKLTNAVAIGDFILVSFNYRLGPFGFMYLPEVGITGNMAFLDQKLALQWIQDNIAKFNGDPGRVWQTKCWSVEHRLSFGSQAKLVAIHPCHSHQWVNHRVQACSLDNRRGVEANQWCF